MLGLLSKETKDKLKNEYPIGSRVKLVCMNDPQAPPIGTKGTVKEIDDIGTIHVNWDNGSTLGTLYMEDEIKRI